jgi:hypothetical protein
MKVSTEIDNKFGYETITQLVDNIPLTIFNNLRKRYSWCKSVFCYDEITVIETETLLQIRTKRNN